MKILFVLECANGMNNGTTATCIRFAKELENKGHEIKTIGCAYKEGETKPENYIEVPHFYFPIFEGIIRKEGFNFVRCHPKYLIDAIKWADHVHILLPMKFGNVARLLAYGLGKPVSTAFHLQPQNITSALHMQKLRFINDIIYRSFCHYFYRGIRYVHCPSEMIRQQLLHHGYSRNKLVVISNGVIPFFYRIDAKKPAEYADKFVVTMSGRLAGEKRQDLILKAIAHSKYKDNIQIIFCGQGPKEKKYRKQIKKLNFKNQPILKFCNAEELREILCYTDVYVHASDFEIEGISALEAIACGATPVISDAKASATNAFALDEHSIFRHGSWKSLKERIEWLYENEAYRLSMIDKYVELGKQYALSNMVDKMEEFLFEAVKEKQEGRELTPKKKDLRKIRRIFKKLYKEGYIDSIPETAR